MTIAPHTKSGRLQDTFPGFVLLCRSLLDVPSRNTLALTQVGHRPGGTAGLGSSPWNNHCQLGPGPEGTNKVGQIRSMDLTDRSQQPIPPPKLPYLRPSPNTILPPWASGASKPKLLASNNPANFSLRDSILHCVIQNKTFPIPSNCAIFIFFFFSQLFASRSGSRLAAVGPQFPGQQAADGAERPDPLRQAIHLLLLLQLHVRSFSHGQIAQPDWLLLRDATLGRPQPPACPGCPYRRVCC